MFIYSLFRFSIDQAYHYFFFDILKFSYIAYYSMIILQQYFVCIILYQVFDIFFKIPYLSMFAILYFIDRVICTSHSTFLSIIINYFSSVIALCYLLCFAFIRLILNSSNIDFYFIDSLDLNTFSSEIYSLLTDNILNVISLKKNQQFYFFLFLKL